MADRIWTIRLGADTCHEITHIGNSSTGGWKRNSFTFTSGEKASSHPSEEDRWHLTYRKLVSGRAEDWVSKVARCEDAKW
jgi:hypothetical protein